MSHQLQPKESEVLRRGRNEFLETMWLAARRIRRRVDNQQETIEFQPARRKDSIDRNCYKNSSSPDSDCTEDNLPFEDEQACGTFNSTDATQNHNPVPKATSYVDFMVVLSMDRSAAGDDFVKLLLKMYVEVTELHEGLVRRLLWLFKFSFVTG